ncbi:MAG: hypothetical protein Q7R98_01605 [Candidatus Jorgensenbacteria bacterium]|nr:hypothetical protein [Candidatus Jorgensenbacteria bacterium]
MFQNRRFVIAIFIVLIGAGISFWIVNSKSKTGNVASLFEIIRSGVDSGRFATSSVVATNTDSAVQQNPNSITERVIQRYQQEIFNANKFGVGTSSPITVPNEATLGNIISDELSRGIAIKHYETKDIKISNDFSKEAALAYLKNIQNTYIKNFHGQDDQYLAMVADAVINQSAEKLQGYLTTTSDQITDLLAITAPPNLASFHLDFINAWNERYELGKAVLDGNQDSLKPLAALQGLSDAVNNEEQLLASFQNTLSKL